MYNQNIGQFKRGGGVPPPLVILVEVKITSGGGAAPPPKLTDKEVNSFSSLKIPCGTFSSRKSTRLQAKNEKTQGKKRTV